MRATVRTSIPFDHAAIIRHNHHHAWTRRTSCQVCTVYGNAYLEAGAPEPVLDVWGGTYTQAEVVAHLVDLLAHVRSSDGWVTEWNAFQDALQRFVAAEEEGR